MSISLYLVIALFSLMQWYKKYVELNLELEVGTLLSARAKSFFNDMFENHSQIVRVEVDGEVVDKITLKEQFEIGVVESDLLKLVSNLQVATKVRSRMKRLNWVHDHLTFLILFVLAAQFLVYCKNNIHILNGICQYVNNSSLTGCLTVCSSDILLIDRLATIVTFFLFGFYVYNFLLCYNFKASKS